MVKKYYTIYGIQCYSNSEIHNVTLLFKENVSLYQVKLCLFYDVKTTHSTLVGKEWNLHLKRIGVGDSKY